jgi:hypothetical protein
MLDVFSDVTGQERSFESSLHKLQMRYNNEIRMALSIKREDHVGTLELLHRSGLSSINDLSVRANCVMAWRVLSEFGDTQEMAIHRLNPHKFGRDTRAAAGGKMCSVCVCVNVYFRRRWYDTEILSGLFIAFRILD